MGQFLKKTIQTYSCSNCCSGDNNSPWLKGPLGSFGETFGGAVKKSLWEKNKILIRIF